MERLHILLEAYVIEILTDDDLKAYGVKYVKNGKTYTVVAKKEIIVSAGVFGTPHLLMMSGIGPKEELKRFGIPVRVNLPGVGSNLQDHLYVMRPFVTDIKLSETEKVDPEKQFILDGRGLLAGDEESFFVTRNSRYFNTTKSFSREERPFPDIASLIKGSRSSDGNLTLNVFVILTHPKSTGKVSLKSADPRVLPIIDPNYYSNQDDLDIHVEGYRLMEEFEKSTAFVQARAKYVQPKVCQDLFTPTTPRPTEFYECVIKHSASHMFHACGTAKIGRPTDKSAVVDHELRVYGVRNLRVADASVMPHVTTANLQAPCYMIGEKAAEMIRAMWSTD